MLAARGSRRLPSACVHGCVLSAVKLTNRRERWDTKSNFGILGKCKRVFHVDPEIAHRILDFAMTERCGPHAGCRSRCR